GQPGGVDEDNSAHPAGCHLGHHHRDPHAHRPADDVESLSAELIGHLDDVAGVRGPAVSAWPAVAAAATAARVESELAVLRAVQGFENDVEAAQVGAEPGYADDKLT